MPYLIGVDEAGYGPNLGPLVVAATVFEAGEEVTHPTLYDHLRSVVTPRRIDPHDARLWITDSKSIYRGGGGLGPLESNVLSILSGMGSPNPGSLSGLWSQLDPYHARDVARIPWFAAKSVECPSQSKNSVPGATGCRSREVVSPRVKLIAVEASIIVERRFNAILRVQRNKSQLLSRVTLALVQRILAERVGTCEVLCDKHGGRNAYGGHLQHVFPDSWVQVLQESRCASRYRIVTDLGERCIGFAPRSEVFLAPALASMVAKYIRELAMLAINRFWSSEVPGLSSTAGYPIDARRYFAEIREARERLGIPDAFIWRAR